jgi:hypothetical protein
MEKEKPLTLATSGTNLVFSPTEVNNMSEWLLDDSRSTPTFISHFPQNLGQLVVKKAASWVWVGFFTPEKAMARGSGYKTSDEAKAAALEWTKKLPIHPA